MMKINVVCVGKIKEKYYEDAVNEYVKRLARYAKVTIKELKEVNFNAEPTGKDILDISDFLGGKSLKIILGIIFYLFFYIQLYNRQMVIDL